MISSDYFGLLSLEQEGFRRVDYDYIVGAARLAKQEGCKHFHLLSSQGANPNSLFLYTKVKVRLLFWICFKFTEIIYLNLLCQGQTETALTQMLFERLSIYRPASVDSFLSLYFIPIDLFSS